MEKALNPDKFELGDIVEPKHRVVAKIFECGACGCIPLNPVQAPLSSECGHVFCESCANEPRCLVCEEDVPSAERQPLLQQDNARSKLYAELPVHCPYSPAHGKSGNSQSLDSSFGDTETCAEDQETTDEENEEHGEGEQARHTTPSVMDEVQCGWKGTMQEMRSHLLECPFQLIKCPSGIAFRRKDIENHRQTGCPCSFETCPICDERVKVGTMEQHRAEKAGEHVPFLEEKLKDRDIDIKAWEKRFSELEGTVKVCKDREIDVEAWEKRFSELEGTVKEREKEINALEKRISELEGTAKEREKENKASEERFSELEGPVKEREKENKASEKRISELEGTAKAEIKAAQERISELEGTVKEREKDNKASEKRISELEGTGKEPQRQQEREKENKASEKRISELEGTAKEELAQQSSASTFEWEIKNPAEMKAKHPKPGDRFWSPEFFLRGLGPWEVLICPSGFLTDPGGVGVFLIGSASTASAKVEGRLTVNGEAHELGEMAIRGYVWGRPKLPGFAWPASDTEPVRVKVEILKVTNFAVTK